MTAARSGYGTHAASLSSSTLGRPREGPSRGASGTSLATTSRSAPAHAAQPRIHLLTVFLSNDDVDPTIWLLWAQAALQHPVHKQSDSCRGSDLSTMVQRLLSPLQVFFVRDGAQFPDLVHSAKPSPVNRLSPGWRLADFLSWHPESMNIVSTSTTISAYEKHMSTT